MDPITISMMLAQLGGSVMKMTAQSKKAKQDKAFYLQQKAANETAIKKDYYNNVSQVLLRQQQEQEAAGVKSQQAYIKNIEAKATAKASALENGVSGNSIESLYRGYDRAIAQNDYYSARNLQMMGMQTEQSLASLKANMESAINTNQPFNPASITQTNTGANLLTAFNSLATGYSQGRQVSRTF